MRNIVKVTRRGQTTIPVELRERFGIREGDALVVEPVEGGLLFKPIPRLAELAGAYSKFGRAEEIKRELDRIREEY
ncbi:MAG: AbrB/MazE/SpoVT family DNA-binding domain-containing protein [Candidatus Bathyarchaeia archaeon]